MTTSRYPLQDEIAQERCLFWLLAAESVSIIALTVVALVTGSLTLTGAVLRASLAVFAGCFSSWVLHRKHRHRFGWLEYGSGKLERLASGVYGVVMFAFAVFISFMILNAVMNYGAQPTPLDRAVAAIARSVHLLVNALGFMAIFFLAQRTRSQILGAQLHVMSVMLTYSVFVQIMLTFSVLAQDAAAAFVWDLAGALFVGVLMFRTGGKMVVDSMPDLLDAPASESELEEAKSLVMQFFRADEIASMKSRRSGLTVFLDVELYQNALIAAAAGLNKTNTLRKLLNRLSGNVKVKLIVGPEEKLPGNPTISDDLTAGRTA